MLDYKLSFDINVQEGDDIEALIVTRKDFEKWKDNNDTVQTVYQKKERRINDIFIPASSDSYVLVLNNRYSNAMKKVSVALTHTWNQEIETHDQG